MRRGLHKAWYICNLLNTCEEAPRFSAAPEAAESPLPENTTILREQTAVIDMLKDGGNQVERGRTEGEKRCFG